MVIVVSADGLGPNGTKPPAGKALATQLDIPFLWKLIGYLWIWLSFCGQMIILKMMNKNSSNIVTGFISWFKNEQNVLFFFPMFFLFLNIKVGFGISFLHYFNCGESIICDQGNVDLSILSIVKSHMEFCIIKIQRNFVLKKLICCYFKQFLNKFFNL